ncbi:PREDICTED: solute carrier family 13 member 5-like [Amphimedon queenslandica]|uniref:Citrate transporter-like domain-containing protein n=1 Tax=Amphimedon queenslandica TaxID=400682 RepID=A0A1X7UFF6_AMPQE|nr:PREDICTED: solute carrier family 13 member 5-like [Amphimedon queenslandica]|eukprot:XP_019854709.1 PREDICTED: solute carrier family 13 member 5-like [Amphimedon queenslandica]
MAANGTGDDASLLEEEEEEGSPNEGDVPMSRRQVALDYVKGWWRTAVIVVTPILFCPIPFAFDLSSEACAFYTIAIIAVYWITEAIPLAATSLLPLFLFPALGVLTAGETAINYLNDTNMLFVGGLMVAVAIEKWNLHKRIALLVLLLVGSSPKWLLLGFMCVTAFLSMWISNTATAAMMLPIAQAVLQEISEHSSSEVGTDTGGGGGGEPRTEDYSENVQLVSARQQHQQSYNSTESSEEEKEDEIKESPIDVKTESITEDNNGYTDDRQEIMERNNDNNSETASVQHPKPTPGFSWLAKGLMLGVAYSANIGGIATLTGTGPNLVFKGDIEQFFPDGPGINFGLWFAFAFPLMILCLSISWMYLSLLFCNDCFGKLKRLLCRKAGASGFYSSKAARNVLRQQYKRLGPWKFAEIELLCCFVILALLWLTREPQFITGWGAIFKTDDNMKSYFSDSSTVIFIVLLLFILPTKPCCFFRRRRHCSCSCPADGRETLLDWDSVHHKLPWNVVLLLGSGFALADGADKSGLSCVIGKRLLGIRHVPDVLKVLSVSVIIASVTEVISNVATTTLFLPILAQLAVALSLNPFYLMLPATVSASFAFMLPVATPPNAIAFTYRHLKVYDMVLTGIFMNIICVFAVNLAVNTWAVPLFDLHTFPNWTTTSGSISGKCNYTATF